MDKLVKLKLDYRKNDMLDALLKRYYLTYSYTLDTIELVGEKVNKKIHKRIFKSFKKHWRQVDKLYKKQVRAEKRAQFKQRIIDYFKNKKLKRLERKAKRKALKLQRKKTNNKKP